MQRVELTIDRLAATGDGVAHWDGRAVFIPGVLPGEKVLVELTPRARALHAEVVELLEAAPGRREPACPLAGTCGGCDWMQAGEALQRAEKRRIVVSALEHVGGLDVEALGVAPPAAPPRALGYRRRAVLHPEDGRLGFYGRRKHDLVPVETCPALTPALADLPGKLSQALGAQLKEVDEVHLLEAGGAVAVSIHAKGPVKPRLKQAAQALLEPLGLRGVVLVPGRGKPGADVLGQPVLEEDGVRYRPDGFAQANAEVNRQLVAHAVEGLGLTGAESVLELYAGNGNFTFALAPKAGRVVAVESSPISVSLAQEVAARGPRGQVRFVQGDAAKVAQGLAKEGERFDRLLLDPPRTGAPGVGAWASKLLVSRVVYVACDPVALARDAKELAGFGYRPVSLTLFDLFPQTHHVEAVMALAR